MDALYVQWNMWYTMELTNIYTYNYGLKFLKVVREKSSARLYNRNKDIRFHIFVNLILIMCGFQSIKCQSIVFEVNI